MSQILKTEPAYAADPGTTVTGDGVIISAVFHGSEPCGVILYHIPDGRSVKVPFSDDFRFGSLYSVKISPLDTSVWCYRLYKGENEFVDPCCRSLVRAEALNRAGNESFLAGGFFYEPDDRLPAYRPVRAGSDEGFVYSLHVKGFTMLAESLASVPGTFSAAAEKAAYLRDLGVTAVELMPVYELQPDPREGKQPRTMEDALALYPVNRDGFPIRDITKKRVNYWGYGKGFYYAPKADYSTPGYEGGPQKEFSDMVQGFHDAGIRVFLQLFFPASVSSRTQADIARFYVTHYEVDGFHLMGSVADIRDISTDPILSDTRLIYTDFPVAEIAAADADSPGSGEIPTEHLSACGGRFPYLIRRFVKSDGSVMKQFLYEFLKVPAVYGNVHYVCGTDGFTLRDLVSYNEKHNEENGEGGADGTSDNYSWNCGEEGETELEDVLSLRRRQIRNFLTLLFLSQSTPLLRAGDENYNTQYGNNNPYCQDNETGWVKWENGDTGEQIRGFVRRILTFRRQHPLFMGTVPFKNIDTIGCGYPDLSLHGADAWRPDLSDDSRSIGICLCENYAGSFPQTELIYIAINMHWETQELGLPKLAPGRRWSLLIDTSLEDPFIAGECVLDDQHIVETEPRSIRILGTVTSDKPVRRRKRKPVRQTEKTEPAAVPAAEDDGTEETAAGKAAKNKAQGKVKTDEKE